MDSCGFYPHPRAKPLQSAPWQSQGRFHSIKLTRIPILAIFYYVVNVHQLFLKINLITKTNCLNFPAKLVIQRLMSFELAAETKQNLQLLLFLRVNYSTLSSQNEFAFSSFFFRGRRHREAAIIRSNWFLNHFAVTPPKQHHHGNSSSFDKGQKVKRCFLLLLPSCNCIK